MRSWLSRRRPFFSYQAKLWLLLTPYLLGTLVLVALPALATVVIAFTTYYAIRPAVWAGLDNFQRLWVSPVIRLSLQNSLLFLVMAVPLRLLGALLLALLLQRRRRLFGALRAAVYLPTIVPEAAYALIWLWIFNPVSGPLNIILSGLGLPAPAWLAEPGTARLAIVILSAFQIGEGFVVVLAGLQSIPRSLYESAAIDGANAWQSFWRITLPLIAPWLLLLTFRDMLVSLQNTFTPTFILTYGGPYYATTFMPLMTYELFYDIADFGLASAYLVIAYIMIGLLIFGIYNIVVGLRGGTDDV